MLFRSGNYKKKSVQFISYVIFNCCYISVTTKLGTLEAVSETVPPSKLIYAANSDIVRVNAETGNVFLNAVVDREV